MSKSERDISRQAVSELEAFEQQLPANIQQQLNVRRQRVINNKPKGNFYLSMGLAASLALVLLVSQFSSIVELKPNSEEQVTIVQTEMFDEDIQMLAQLEFVYWLSEQEVDEAG